MRIQVIMEVGGQTRRELFEFDGGRDKFRTHLTSGWVWLSVIRPKVSSLNQQPITDSCGATIWEKAPTPTLFNAEVIKAVDLLPDVIKVNQIVGMDGKPLAATVPPAPAVEEPAYDEQQPYYTETDYEDESDPDQEVGLPL